MKSIISICEEYSDNVWYSGFDGDSMPSKIAIEIEKQYKNTFLKLINKHGYKLDSVRRKDNDYSILQLMKSKKTIKYLI